MNDELNVQPTTDAAAPAETAPAVAAPATSMSQAQSPAAALGRAMGGQRGGGRFQQRGGNGRGGQGGGQRGGGRGGRPGGPRRDGEVPAEADYEEKNLEIARVTRVTKGGKRMRFRALSVIGNRKGRVGFGLAKGMDVAAATSKATTQARKSLVTVPLVNDTIPHAVEAKFGAAHVLLKPAPKGTGVKAGGAVRTVLELAGIPSVVSKMLGSSNKINNVKATFEALKMLRLSTKKDMPAVEEPKA